MRREVPSAHSAPETAILCEPFYLGFLDQSTPQLSTLHPVLRPSPRLGSLCITNYSYVAPSWLFTLRQYQMRLPHFILVDRCLPLELQLSDNPVHCSIGQLCVGYLSEHVYNFCIYGSLPPSSERTIRDCVISVSHVPAATSL